MEYLKNMAEQIAVETVVSIIKDEMRLASDAQKVMLRRVLHEVRYVAFRNAHPADDPTWIRRGDVRIGRRGSTFDSLGNPVIGKITAILRYQDGSERLEVIEGTVKTGTTTVWPDAADVDIL